MLIQYVVLEIAGRFFTTLRAIRGYAAVGRGCVMSIRERVVIAVLSWWWNGTDVCVEANRWEFGWLCDDFRG